MFTGCRRLRQAGRRCVRQVHEPARSPLPIVGRSVRQHAASGEHLSKFTGKGRRYRTSKAIRYGDALARTCITLGGICTILAVTGVFVFLVSVVVPLFMPAAIEVAGKARPVQSEAAIIGTDEYLLVGWLIADNGARLSSFRLDNGAPLASLALFGGERPRALSYFSRERKLTAAMEDGSLRQASISFATEFIADNEAGPELARLKEGELASWDGAVIQRTPEGQLRAQKVAVSYETTIAAGFGDIILLDMSMQPSGPVIASLGADGSFRINSASSTTNLFTGESTSTLTGGELKLDLADRGLPAHLLLSGQADTVYLVWEDGHLLRLDTREIEAPVIAEELKLIPGHDAQITSLSFLIGKTSLVAGDSMGRVSAWFRTKPAGAATVDGAILTRVHDLGRGPAAVTSLVPSLRSRMLAVGFADGSVRLNQVTSDKVLAEEKVGKGLVRALFLSPKDDAFAALTQSGIGLWRIAAPHAEVALQGLFFKMHYEGMNEPAHVWQSSSGTDDFEPKFGLMPLIFGTLKATFYSMFFGVPLALLAAIYTSEFLDNRRLKARIKPLVEMMGSLPTVVLGFLAALIFAPMVEDIVPEILVAFVTVPLSFVFGAYLFQLLPVERFVRYSRFRFGVLAFVCLPLGLSLATLAGPALEQLLFAGNLKGWLDGRLGSGFAGWFLMFLPAAAFLAIFTINSRFGPWLGKMSLGLGRRQAGLLELARFMAGSAMVLFVAALLAWSLTGLGIDSRAEFPVVGAILHTYIQRNALVVGFIMGFAIIPTIYTLAEDALHSVPEHLRAASLAAGATPWQTAIRIIIPTAASGLFSAVMLGLGRAVGETMIVLMAAGNTPVMEMNIFNGFRTLSANIAVELPEAVIFSTHYRVLFLAALTLFLLTFTVNTIAEIVRQRFRKRAFEL